MNVLRVYHILILLHLEFLRLYVNSFHFYKIFIIQTKLEIKNIIDY